MQGRQGKGPIFVFAAGNGGLHYDTCATDGYISSIYTIAVGSLSADGSQAIYDEQCSGKLVAAFVDDLDVFPYTDVVMQGGDTQKTTQNQINWDPNRLFKLK